MTVAGELDEATSADPVASAERVLSLFFVKYERYDASRAEGFDGDEGRSGGVELVLPNPVPEHKSINISVVSSGKRESIERPYRTRFVSALMVSSLESIF